MHPEHAEAIADQIERRDIRKQYYLETRGDVLLRNKDVFRRWKRLGLEYMFLGLEAIDEEGLKAHRKRTTTSKNLEALEFARSLGITVAINIIADPAWDVQAFSVLRNWAATVPEIVHVTVNTPYPGTETWQTEACRVTSTDYRLFDVQHAVLPTKLPLEQFYRELVATQRVLNQKWMGWTALRGALRISIGHTLRGHTNFLRMLWKFGSVYNVERQLHDHRRATRYHMRMPSAATQQRVDASTLYVLRG